jgi:hypothetical protein
LLRVHSTGAFDTTSVTASDEAGKFLFKDVILDDYLLLGFVDTVTYHNALPTYFKGTIFWEEADTLFVERTVDTLSIVSQYKPVELPKGKGTISGYLVQDDGTEGGRVKRPERVSNAGVSARRVQTTGRSKEVTLTLIAYQFTNEDGEFNFTNLEVGKYLLNIQYPGYPMDNTSDIYIEVGEGVRAYQQVAASVEDGKIVVRQFIITSIWNSEGYHAEVYPNPTSMFINLEFASESASRNIVLYDNNGRQLIKTSVPGRKASVDIRSFKKGNYLLNMHDKGSLVKTMQVIIE